MSVEFFLYAFIGRLLVFAVQKFPTEKIPLLNRELLQELINCDLCLGFWVYLVLSFWMDVTILIDEFLLAQIVTAFATSLAVHLMRVGFDTEFKIIKVE